MYSEVHYSVIGFTSFDNTATQNANAMQRVLKYGSRSGEVAVRGSQPEENEMAMLDGIDIEDLFCDFRLLIVNNRPLE